MAKTPYRRPRPRPKPIGGILLEDFAGSSLRTTADGTTPLWSVVTGADSNPNQTGSFDAVNHAYKIVCNGVPGGSGGYTSYLQFFPKSNNSYAYPNGYLSHYIKSGVWSASGVNRLRFRYKVDKDIARGTVHGTMNLGTYIRDHAAADGNYQGAHYYHSLALSQYANEWTYVQWYMNPEHQVGADVNLDFPVDPEWGGTENVHYWDGETRFYFAQFGTPAQATDSTWLYTDFYCDLLDNTEPLATVQPSNNPSPILMHLVRNIGVIYNPGTGKYDMTWTSPKWLAQSYRVAYKTSSMKAAGGWGSGTWDGTTVDASADAYTMCLWTSPSLSKQDIYFGVKPVGNNPNGYFSEIHYIPVS